MRAARKTPNGMIDYNEPVGGGLSVRHQDAADEANLTPRRTLTVN